MVGNGHEVLFKTGEIHLSEEAFQKIVDSDIAEGLLVARHRSGDFGEISETATFQNHIAIRDGYPISSVYDLPEDRGRLRVITDSNRKRTTILLD